MHTFDYEKTPIVPPYCLWVSGLLMISGCRAEAGLPRLQRAWQPVGNRPEMGKKAPGAWGAPGADPREDRAGGLASVWAGFDGERTQNGRVGIGTITVRHSDFLLCGDVARQAAPQRAGSASPNAAADSREIGAAGILPSEEPRSYEVPVPAANGGGCATAKVKLLHKPEPWNGSHASGKGGASPRPASFCRRIVTFTPAPTPKPAVG